MAVFAAAAPNALTTTRYINSTFAHAGNALGIVLALGTITMTSRAIIASLEEYQTVTSFTIATERINKVAHGLNNNDIVSFTTTGALVTGLTVGVQYYVVNKNADDFQVSTTLGGSAVLLSGTASGTASVGVQRATVTLTTEQITNGANNCTGAYAYRGIYITDFPFAAGYAVDVTASKWRFRIGHGSGTGTWNLYSSDATITGTSYAAYCDNVKTFSDTNDCLVVKNYLTIDQSATLSMVNSTGDTTNKVSMWVCSNVNNPSPAVVNYLKWDTTPAASYTLTIPGNVFSAAFGGIQIGYEQSTTCTISNANPGVVTKTGHGLVANQMISFTTTGVLPNNLVSTQGFYYYVKTVLDGDTFTFSATPGGAAIDTTGTQSGVHTLLWGRIPIAQKAVLSFSGAAAAVGNWYQPAANASYTYGGLSSFFFYGQLPKYEYTTLTVQANSGTATLTCVDAVDWVNGDKVVVGKQDVQGQGDTAQYTVQGVAGNNITLAGNLATYNRKIGATVMKLDCHGVKIQSTTAAVTHAIYYYAGANFSMSGCDMLNMQLSNQATTYYYYVKSVKTTYRSGYYIGHFTFWTDTTAGAVLGYFITPDLGATIEYGYLHRVGLSSYLFAYYANTHTSGRLDVRYLIHVARTSTALGFQAGGNGTLNCKISMYNNRFENVVAGYSAVVLNGINCEHYNNYYWGTTASSQTNAGAVQVGQYISPLRVGNNTYENNSVAISFGPNVGKGCVDVDSIFGQETANTSDLHFTPGGLPDYVLKSPTGELTKDVTYLPDTIPGTRVSIESNDGLDKHDETSYTFLDVHRTHSTLSDTVVHTAGGSAVRFTPLSASGTDLGEWIEIIPTGDISNKTMVFGVWVCINHSNYWAGVHQMPRMTATYDGTSTAYVEAARVSRDQFVNPQDAWQFMVLPVTPTTNAGSITITLSGMTDATTTDRYIYWDDRSNLYPQGYSVNFGLLDDWSLGLPVTPTISTGFNELGVWSSPTTVDYGTNTMGQLVKQTEVKVDDTTALLLT